MKLLIGMPDPTSWGGVQACEPPFTSALKKLQDIQVSEITYVYGDKLQKASPIGRVSRVLHTARRLRTQMDRSDYDLVHLNTAFDIKTVLRDLVTVAAIGGFGARIFLKFHGSDRSLIQTSNPVKRLLWRRLVSRVDGIGVLSTEERDNFVKAGVAPSKLFVVKNAVQPWPTLPREFGSASFRFLFVARFVPTKGLIETIQAAALLREKGYDLELRCIGDGEVRAQAESLTRALGLETRVKFTGYVPEGDVNEHYRASDCLVFPTFHDEGFPMVVFNAVAAGLPIITTRIRAAKDYLLEPVNCLWTKAHCPADTAAQMIRLLEDRRLCREMSENNIALAARFRADAIAHEYLAIYRTLLRDCQKLAGVTT